MFVTIAFFATIFVLTFVYFRGKYNQNYWKKLGVAFYDKHKTGGPFWQFAIEDKSFTRILNDIYDEYADEPAVGMGSLFNKALYVKDLENLQQIYQGDFQSFYDRGVPITDEDILANNVLFLAGPKWKLLRHKLSPLFTGAKLKNMYYIIDRCAHDFLEFLKSNPDKLKKNTYDTISHYSTAALSAAVFGIGTKSTFDSPFRLMAQKAISATRIYNLKFIIGGLSTRLYKTLGLKLWGKYEGSFIKAMKTVIRHREKEELKRHDFADMCVSLQKNGTMHDPDTGLNMEPTDEVLAAQAFFFFIAGGEPSTGATFATVMELGRNPDILKRVHEEIDGVFEKYNNQLTYDAIQEVEYLSNTFKESIRLHTPIGFLSRECTQDTVLPVGNIKVEKGVKIFLPVFELHHDPKYFPNPEVFDPDRFSREGEVNDMTYVPFGRGNRYCIGVRYARLQILTCLMYLLRNYTVRTYVHKGGLKYKKEQNIIRMTNVDVELIPRNI